MSNLIIVAHPETKALFTETKNPDWFKCQVRQEGIKVNNGVIQSASRSAFPLIQKSVVDMLTKQGLKDGATFPIEGQIVRYKSRFPMYEGQTPVVNPSTGEVYLVDGESIYMQDVFTTDMSLPSEVTKTVELVPASN